MKFPSVGLSRGLSFLPALRPQGRGISEA